MSLDKAIPHDTIVQSPASALESRRVFAVDEWRVECALRSNAVVLSMVTPCGTTQSFQLEWTDAQDIAEVLRRKTRALPNAVPRAHTAAAVGSVQ